MRLMLKGVLLSLYCVLLVACGQSSSDNSQIENESDHEEFARIRVSLPGVANSVRSSHGKELRAVNSSQIPAEIDAIVIEVLNSSNRVLASGDILASGGELSLEIVGGKHYTVRGIAYAGSERLFSGSRFVPSIANGEQTTVSLSLLEQVTLRLDAVSDQLIGGAEFQLNTVLSGLSNTVLSWSVNGIDGGNSVYGLISSEGAYTPPTSLPVNSLITIVATPSAAPSFAQSVSFNLLPPGNQPPVANAGSDQLVTAGATVTLDGSGSSDADGAIVSYQWSFVSGDANPLINNANQVTASFTAPDLQYGGSSTFRLTVTDDDGATSSNDVLISFSASDQAVLANAGVDLTVTEGDLVSLDATASADPDNVISTYSWQQVSGTSVSLNNADSATPGFTAPDVSADEDLVFRVTVTNDIGLQASDSVTVRVNDSVSAASNVYFAAATNGFTYTLWTSDGTESGTQQLNSLQVQNSDFASALQVADYYYFSGNDGVNGTELWRTNGTVSGTEMLPVADESEYSSGASASSNPGNFAVLGNRLLLGANTSQVGGFNFPEFVSVDASMGSIATSDFTVVHDDRPSAGYGHHNRALATYNGYVYFMDADYSGPTYSLYRTNGLASAELVVSGLNSFDAHDFTELNGELYFVVGASDLWKTDGSTTTLLKTFSGRAGYSFASDSVFVPFAGGAIAEGGRMYFVADDGDGRELWSSNGVSANAPDTVQILDLDGDSASSSYPFAFRSVNNRVVFMSQNGDSSTDGLWVTDGTSGGTSRLAAISVGDEVGFYSGNTDSEPVVINIAGSEQLFFVGNDGVNGAELWVSDGTASGTSMVTDLRSGAQGSEPGILRDGGGYLIFSAQDDDGRAKLWRSDGSESGTALVKDICPTDCFENTAFFGFGA